MSMSSTRKKSNSKVFSLRTDEDEDWSFDQNDFEGMFTEDIVYPAFEFSLAKDDFVESINIILQEYQENEQSQNDFRPVELFLDIFWKEREDTGKGISKTSGKGMAYLDSLKYNEPRKRKLKELSDLYEMYPMCLPINRFKHI